MAGKLNPSETLPQHEPSQADHISGYGFMLGLGIIWGIGILHLMASILGLGIFSDWDFLQKWDVIGMVLRVVSYVAVPICIARSERLDIRRALCLGRVGTWVYVLAVLSAIGIFVIGMALQWYLFYGSLSLDSFLRWIAPKSTFMQGLHSPAALGALFFAPIPEEIFYRGFIFTFLQRKFGSTVAFWSVAILFTSEHFHGMIGLWPLALAFLPSGLFFSYLRLKMQSLYPLIVAHFVMNLLFAVAFPRV